jgi:multiple sugar transport system ATP-binding protein
MARVLLENVTKIFDGGVVAVSNFNIDVADGEFMVVVGPSGCGKTTTLRMIAGLEQPTAGSIYIGDMPVNDVRPKDRDVAMVFQNYALYPHMTVRQNMAFALKMRNVPADKIRKRVEQTAGLLGIGHLLGRRPAALSGGQRQRVALGRAIVRNPRAFLFDEPLSNLDAGLRVAMRAELKALRQRLHTTSIYVTHDQVEAMILGDRICVMYDGTVQQTGVPMEVYERPINRFVAGFLGTPAMNFFTGHLKPENDAIYFVTGNDRIMLPKRLATVLSGYREGEIVLGIRPESISPNQFSGQRDNAISAAVNVIEPVGIRTDIHLTSPAGTRLVASVGPHTELKPNDVVKIYIDLKKVHLFEPGQTGRNIAVPERPLP